MGWNALSKAEDHPITRGIPEGGHVYFTHSYILDAKDPSDVIAWTDHGSRFVAAVSRIMWPGCSFTLRRARLSASPCSAIFWIGVHDPLSRDRPEGRPVRAPALRRHGQATVFNTSPGDQAEQFAKAGFDWLHVVDLNGAIEGRAVNTEAVNAILTSVSIPVQLGGGVRPMRTSSAGLKRACRG